MSRVQDGGWLWCSPFGEVRNYAVALLTFDFSTCSLHWRLPPCLQVDRGVELHCGLAEALVRVEHLEKRTDAAASADLLTKLFFRMNEMDDLLDMVQRWASLCESVGNADQAVLPHECMETSLVAWQK